MADLLRQISAFAVFLAIAVLGFLVLLVSLVFGEIFEHFGDGADHDLGHGGSSFFSLRILSVFVTAFGGFGAIGVNYGLSTLSSSGLGFLSGVFFAWLIYLFAKFLHGQQATTEVKSGDIVGCSARIIVAIPPGGLGQIRCQVGEEIIDKTARSSDGQPVPENAIVHVEQILGEIAIVRPQ